jgi:steroid delta-isomerase-like uncharacterized protein
MRRPKDVLLAWVEALTIHDAAAAAALYHDDAVNLQVAVGTPLIGKQAIYEDFVGFFAATPDTYTHIENLFEDGEWAILEWSGGGTFRGSEAALAAGGIPYTIRGCGFFQIVDGKIRFQRGYWDKLSWYRQVGLPLD